MGTRDNILSAIKKSGKAAQEEIEKTVSVAVDQVSGQDKPDNSTSGQSSPIVEAVTSDTAELSPDLKKKREAFFRRRSTEIESELEMIRKKRLQEDEKGRESNEEVKPTKPGDPLNVSPLPKSSKPSQSSLSIFKKRKSSPEMTKLKN
jgi:hypothetical protein